MSIFKKAKAAVQKYVSNVVGGAKIVGGAISNAFNTVGSSSQGASVLKAKAIPGSIEASNATSKAMSEMQADYATSQLKPASPSGTLRNISGITTSIVPGVAYGTNTLNTAGSSSGVSTNYAPRTISSGSSTPKVDSSFYSPTSASTLTATTVGGGSGAVSLGGNASQVSLPSNPTNRDTGVVNLAGLANAETRINPDTGLFDTQGTLKQEDKEDEITQAIRELKDIPERENVFENEYIIEQQREIRQRQKEVNNWQGQLNSIVAKQQQDLMRHEKEISLAGGTEEGFSGRAAAINREAAYAALPIQAQLATAQGNLELAQNYLRDLTTMVKEEIDNNYTYKVAQYNAVKEIADKREKAELDKLEKEENRAYKERNDNLSLIDFWMQEAVSTQQPNLVGRLSKLNIDDPNFREKLAGVIGQIREPVSTNITENPKSYTIRSGDTYFDLAQKLGSSVEALRIANPGLNENNLQVGQKINLSLVQGIKNLSVNYGYTPGEIKAYLTKEAKISSTVADQLLKDAGLLESKGSSGSSSSSSELSFEDF